MSLVGWWPLNNNLKNNCGDKPLSYSGSFSYGVGKVTNRCGTFNGSNTYLYQNVNFTSEMSFSLWLKFNSNSAFHIMDCRNSSGNGYQPMYGGPTYGFQFWSSNASSVSTEQTWTSSVCGFTTGTWYHIVVTCTSSYSELFINGVSKGKVSGSFGYNFGISQMRLGSRYTGANWLNGYINDVRIYNHVLSTKEIKELARGLMIHYKLNFEDLYLPVDYVEFTGTQYISSGLTSLTASNFSIEIDFQRTNTDNADACLFGQRQFGKFTNIYNTYFESAYGNTASGTANNTDRTVLVMNQTGIYKNGTALILGSISSISSSYPALIGAFSEDSGSNAKWWYKGRIFSLKVINNGTLVRHYIPCLRKVDCKPGLFDLVNNTFNVNAGTGDLVTPIRYIPVEYIQSDGNQYINTYITLNFNEGDGFKVVAQPSTASQNGFILGSWTTSNNYYWLYHYQSGSVIRMYLTNASYGQENFNLGLSSSNTSKHTYELLNTRMRVDNGSWITASNNTNRFSYDSSGYCYLFRASGSSADSYPYKGRIYSCTLYKKGKPYAEYVPVYDLATRTAGMLNVTSGTLAYQGGSGNFTYGSFLFDELTKIKDASGYNNTGKLVGSVTSLPNTPIGNTSLQFNGSSTYIDTQNTFSNLFKGGSVPFTIAFWVYNDESSSGTGRGIIFGNYYNSATGAFNIEINGGSVSKSLRIYWQGSPDYSSSNIVLDYQTWTHIAIKYNGTTTSIYKNGSFVDYAATTALSSNSMSNTFWLGNDHRSGGQYFQGRIADFRLYATALSAADVLDLYKSKAFIDKSGNLYCNDFIESSNDVTLPTKTSLVEANNLVENTSNVMLQNGYTQLTYIDQVNPAAGATSQHNRCAIQTLQYNYIEARINVNGSGTSGGIMLAGYNGSWWKSWQGGGTSTITMTPTTLTQNVWTDVTWKCGSNYTGLWTSGWSDGTNYWTPQNLKVAYIKTYLNQTLTGYFIPVRRNKDSALGLYNLVTQTFYPNVGTGSFSAGSTRDKASAIFSKQIIEC